MTSTSGSSPVGSSPPWLLHNAGPVSWPSTLKRPARKTVPTTRNVTSASTLISEAQNSISPKTLTEIRFIDTTTTSAIRARTHCGMAWKACQYRQYVAIAVVSTIPVIAQFRKYIQPAAKATFSPKNSRA